MLLPKPLGHHYKTNSTSFSAPLLRTLQRLALLLVGLALLAVGFSSCQHEHHASEAAVQYKVTSPLLRDTSIIREYVGQVKAIQHIELRALERGYLQHIYVDEGQRVRKGQVMFQIMPMLYQAELQKASAEAEFAKIEYANTKRLADSNIVSSSELALAKAKYLKAKAEMDLAATHLSFTKIVAPFDGIMDHFHVREGSLLEEGDLLTYLADNHKMWVYFNIPEAEYLDFKTMRPQDSLLQVQLVMANNQLFNYPGRVETIEADFNNETGNIAFRATFPNPQGLLRHGETGNIRVVVPMGKAILIPQKASYEVLEKRFVFVVDAAGKVHAREINIAASLPDIYIVKSGLEPTDKILLEGLQKVRDGDKISFSYEEPQKVMKRLKVYTE